MSVRVDYDILNQQGTPALYSDILLFRPASGFTGRLFVSIDTKEIYRDNGLGWDLIADAGAGTTGTLQQVTTNGNTTTKDISLISPAKLFIYALSNGGVLFPAGGSGQVSQDNTNFYWDNTNKRLGIRTNTPGVAFDVHSTDQVIQQLNNTTTQDSLLSFLNQNVGKWRIGNYYNSNSNDFIIYDTDSGVTRAFFTNTGYTIFPTNMIIGSSNRSSAYGMDVYVSANYQSTLRVQGASTFLSQLNGTLGVFSTYVQTPQVQASTSAGLSLNANSGTQVANLGAGGGSNITFYGAVTSNYGSSGINFNSNAATTGSVNAYRVSNSVGVGSFGIENSSGNDLLNGGLPNATILQSVSNTTLQFGTLQTARMTITGSGNVGIGITSPASKFHVNTGTNQNFRIRPGTDVGATNGVALNSRTDDDSSLQQLTLRASDVVMLPSGGVGIGTNSPSSILTVLKTITTNFGAKGNGAISLGTAGSSGEANLINFGYDAGTWQPAYMGYLCTNGAGSSNGDLVFATRDSTSDAQPTIRIRINSIGNLLIGTSTDNGVGKLQVQGAITSQGSLSTYLFQDQVTSVNWQLYANSSTARFYNSASGIVANISESTGVYTPTSDYNRKKDIELSTIGLEAILGLKPSLFRMKTENDTKKHLGFIAQEVKEYIPQAYVEEKDFIGLSDRPIIAVLVKAIQELNDKLVRNNIN
jgi:hypothetical protein